MSTSLLITFALVFLAGMGAGWWLTLGILGARFLRPPKHPGPPPKYKPVMSDAEHREFMRSIIPKRPPVQRGAES
jgi:hypothetical protein